MIRVTSKNLLVQINFDHKTERSYRRNMYLNLIDEDWVLGKSRILTISNFTYEIARVLSKIVA